MTVGIPVTFHIRVSYFLSVSLRFDYSCPLEIRDLKPSLDTMSILARIMLRPPGLLTAIQDSCVMMFIAWLKAMVVPSPSDDMVWRIVIDGVLYFVLGYGGWLSARNLFRCALVTSQPRY